MIATISGIVTDFTDPILIVENNGIGYQVSVTKRFVGVSGNEVSLFTYHLM
ncbi:Holliday junction branch migration protein RuvA, partial [Candidatus Berkelbacteria bacterium]|nr:Holliday junction branch migration protein RuvA [Candidatus Berkelbacteria bacterium]